MFKSKKNLFLESDVCNPNPCQNGGTCREESNAAVCACAPQFEGKVCESMCTAVEFKSVKMVDTLYETT